MSYSDLPARLRAAYESGTALADIIRGEPTFKDKYPVDIMFALIKTFSIGLSDVSCIDGWWPPDADSEVSDEQLHRLISEAIEQQRNCPYR